MQGCYIDRICLPNPIGRDSALRTRPVWVRIPREVPYGWRNRHRTFVYKMVKPFRVIVDAYQPKRDRSKAVVTKRLKNPFLRVNPSINALMQGANPCPAILRQTKAVQERTRNPVLMVICPVSLAEKSAGLRNRRS